MEYIQLAKNKATPERGGGEKLVQIPQARSIDQMVKRMLASGELAKANETKHNTHGTKAQAEKLMEKAQPVPLYMGEAEICAEAKKAEEMLKKIEKGEEKIEEHEIKSLETELRKRQQADYKKYLMEKINSNNSGV